MLRQDRVKGTVDWGLWLTEPRWGGEGGVWNAGLACGGRDQHDVATAAMCSPGEVVPGSGDPGSGGLHRLPGEEVWIVTCARTQASWWLQQQP